MSHIVYTDMRPPRAITPPRAAVKRRAELHDHNDTLQKCPHQARADWQYPTFAVTAPSTQPAYCPQEVEPTRPPPNRNKLQGLRIKYHRKLHVQMRMRTTRRIKSQ
ncbi:hypothetical protein M422DRAFT_266800 [Sphaerobolus stellatus SS14]|uniref:Uncharacterized protein n=1 Tax=Sphaerobolus stellatus (strain SS14) TaxID=990650 RepID=A0A0C9UA68_SPHS4|nr:hypothetical protein M422DRAFT_266800 [Sphaerobolus stellatus SS14]